MCSTGPWPGSWSWYSEWRGRRRKTTSTMPKRTTHSARAVAREGAVLWKNEDRALPFRSPSVASRPLLARRRPPLLPSPKEESFPPNAVSPSVFQTALSPAPPRPLLPDRGRGRDRQDIRLPSSGNRVAQDWGSSSPHFRHLPAIRPALFHLLGRGGLHRVSCPQSASRGSGRSTTRMPGPEWTLVSSPSHRAARLQPSVQAPGRPPGAHHACLTSEPSSQPRHSAFGSCLTTFDSIHRNPFDI